MSYEVFLSHSSQDYSLAKEIRSSAARSGIKIYVFEEDLQLGRDWQEKLKVQINACDAMIVLLTHAGSTSANVRDEIVLADAAGKLIIPIIDEGVDSKDLLGKREYLMLNRPNSSETFQRLTDYLVKLKSEDESYRLFIFVALFIVLTILARSE